jgi:hypothetical protein
MYDDDDDEESQMFVTPPTSGLVPPQAYASLRSPSPESPAPPPQTGLPPKHSGANTAEEKDGGGGADTRSTASSPSSSSILPLARMPSAMPLHQPTRDNDVETATEQQHATAPRRQSNARIDQKDAPVDFYDDNNSSSSEEVDPLDLAHRHKCARGDDDDDRAVPGDGMMASHIVGTDGANDRRRPLLVVPSMYGDDTSNGANIHHGGDAGWDSDSASAASSQATLTMSPAQRAYVSALAAAAQRQQAWSSRGPATPRFPATTTTTTTTHAPLSPAFVAASATTATPAVAAASAQRTDRKSTKRRVKPYASGGNNNYADGFYNSDGYSPPPMLSDGDNGPMTKRPAKKAAAANNKIRPVAAAAPTKRRKTTHGKAVAVAAAPKPNDMPKPAMPAGTEGDMARPQPVATGSIMSTEGIAQLMKTTGGAGGGGTPLKTPRVRKEGAKVRSTPGKKAEGGGGTGKQKRQREA